MLVRLLLACALLIGATTPAPAEDGAGLPPESLLGELRQARIAGQRGQAEEQRRLLEAAAEGHPGAPEPLLELLELAEDRGAPDAELQRLRAALRAALATRGLPGASVLRWIERPSSSAEDLRIFEENLRSRAGREPGDTRTLRLLGLVQERLGQYADARATFGRLLEEHPDPAVRYACLRLDRQLGRWEDVLAGSGSAGTWSADPLLRLLRWTALANLGRAAEFEGELAAFLARPDAELRRELDPVRIRPEIARSGADELTDLAWALNDAGRGDLADRTFRRLARLYPANADLQAVVLHLYTPGGASGAQDRALAERWRTETDPLRVLNEGSARLATGNAAAAFEVLRRAVELLPGSDAAWYNLGLAASRLQRWDDAERALGRALEIAPALAVALLERGAVRVRLGRPAEAVADLERALELQPDLRAAHQFLGLAYAALGDEEKSHEVLERSRPAP